MKICPKCGNTHNKTGLHCSRKCANSRDFSEESKRKKSLAAKRYRETLTEDERIRKTRIFQNHSPFTKHNTLSRIMTRQWDELGIQNKRIRVIIEQEGACNKCGLTEWLEAPITLEYEHKDGNKHNNERSNVECLCPNCHAQTLTWRGRSNKGISKISKRTKRVVEYVKLQYDKQQGNGMKYSVKDVVKDGKK